eukprot:3128059-Karenia_brevis.AAC.1
MVKFQSCPEPVVVCGLCCQLKHVEQRHEKHRPDESSETFEHFANPKDDATQIPEEKVSEGAAQAL